MDEGINDVMMMDEGMNDGDVCVETSSPNKPASANLCGCSHVPMTDTSQKDILVRRKATSYLMAAKGLLKKANNNMNKVSSLYSINLK